MSSLSQVNCDLKLTTKGVKEYGNLQSGIMEINSNAPSGQSKIMGFVLALLAIVIALCLITLVILKIIASTNAEAECEGVLDSFGPSDKILRDVIGNPRARLFKVNNEDRFAEFFYNRENTTTPSCAAVPSSMQNGSRISSTFGTCIRTYREEGCVGLSTAYYPKRVESQSENENESENNTPIKSIGPCFTNELDDSIFRLSPVTGNKEFDKRSWYNISSNMSEYAIPDILEISSKLRRNLQEENTEDDPASTFLSLGRTWKNVSTGQIAYCKIYLRKFDLTPEGQLDSDILAARSSISYQSFWNRKVLNEISEKAEKYLKCHSSRNVVLNIEFRYKEENTGFVKDFATAGSNVIGHVFEVKFGNDKTESFYLTNE